MGTLPSLKFDGSLESISETYDEQAAAQTEDKPILVKSNVIRSKVIFLQSPPMLFTGCPPETQRRIVLLVREAYSRQTSLLCLANSKGSQSTME